MSKSKTTFMTLGLLSAFFLGMGINNIALSDSINTDGIKIAVVDVSEVVSASSQVKALKSQQEAKKKELVKWLDTVKADIQKQSTDENKAKLAKKYDADLAKKQEAIRNEYTKKLTEIDKSISESIAQTAKAQGYSVVLAKSAVLYGGDNLTPAVKKAVK